LKRSANDALDSTDSNKIDSNNSPNKKQKVEEINIKNNNHSTINNNNLKMHPAFQYDIQQILRMNEQQLNSFEERLKSKKQERLKTKEEMRLKLEDPKKSILKGDEDGKTSSLISKWKSVCKEAAEELLRLGKQTNPEMKMAQILAFYQIEHELLNFQMESDSFEE